MPSPREIMMWQWRVKIPSRKLRYYCHSSCKRHACATPATHRRSACTVPVQGGAHNAGARVKIHDVAEA